MDYKFNIEVSESNGYKLAGSSNNDTLLYVSAPDTKIHIGAENKPSSAIIGLSNIAFKVAGTDNSNSVISFATGSSNVKVSVADTKTTVQNTLVVNSNVGIGKSNPAYPLDVNGIVNSTGLYVNGAPYIGSQWTTNGSNIYVIGSNIGVNTSNPSMPLHVAGDVLFDSNMYIRKAVDLKGLRVSRKYGESNFTNLTAITNPAGYSWSNGTITMSGDVLPAATQVQNIGSSNLRWKEAWVDTLHIATNTLYLGDTPVLGTESATIKIRGDSNQHIQMSTTGTGTTQIQSDKGVTMSVSGLNGSVDVQASGAGGKVLFGATDMVGFTAPTSRFTGNAEVTGQATISNNLTVKGDLIVQGNAVVLDIASLEVEDNIILLNRNQIGSGVTAGTAGIRIDRGDAADFVAVFDESDDLFKVGMLGAEKIVATRDWAAASNHDAAAITSGVLTVARGGTGVGYSTGTGSNVLSDSPTLTGTVTASNINATTLTGNGAGISNINAGNIASGTLVVARGGTGVGFSTGTGSNVLSDSPTLTGTVMASNIKATNIYTISNVGVGNSNPTYQLDVTGDINFTGSLRQNGSVFTSGSASGWTPVASSITYTTCNVGIGTSNPTYKFHVSESTDSHVAMRLSASSATVHTDIAIANSATQFFTTSQKGDFCVRNTTGCNLLFGYGAGTEVMRVTNQGRLGIGTTTPSYPLHVVGDINFTGSLRQNGTVFSGGTSSGGWTPTSGTITYTSCNVGIGTSSPTQQLQINAMPVTYGQLSPLTVNTTSDGVTTMNWIAASFGTNSASVPRVVMGAYSSRALLGAHSANLGAWAELYINENLVVGTSGTSVRPNADNTTSLGASGTRWSTVWAGTGSINTSDQREKTDIATSDLGLDFINLLHPVSYKFINGGNIVDSNNQVTPVPGMRTHYGLLAQEVKSTLDSLNVSDFAGWVLTDKDDPDSSQGLRYEEFIAPLIKAVQELSAENAALKTDIAQIKQQLGMSYS